MRSPAGAKRRRSDDLNRRRAGFTLIELALVAILLLTVVGLSIPVLKKTFIGLYAQDTSFNISKLINYAQEMAVLDRTNYKIVFNFQDGRYQLFVMDPSMSPPVYKKANGRFGRKYSLGLGLKLTGQKPEPVFYPDGHCDEFQVSVLAKNSGYAIKAKRFGNALEVKEVNIE